MNLSTLTYELVLTTPISLSTSTAKTHYNLVSLQTVGYQLQATPVAQHKHTGALIHVPIDVVTTDTTAQVSPTGSAFNPTLFVSGLFLLAVSVVMFWYLLKRFQLNKPDIQNMVP
ncbi:hypothetical protein KDW_43930 [Dictyobacter vulcani]|uniref:Uncharacterized protein n=1 Tax=Dictyobacter vulcani TaxID=2607529 RepID=A0A5J4KUN0_9CHLR|nr:hypothetical protein [Dictyobacter vulcani]GER90231.1 hypothetical protein KDW_43930 [Dictyobacter vulcani]